MYLPGLFIMLTSKPVGSISYNSGTFFIRTLETLVRTGRIDDYRAIYHYPEDDTKKGHYHFMVYPSRRLDTDDLRKLFYEPDPVNPNHPLGCLPFRYSEPLNWLLYVLHDEDYLSFHPSDSGGDGKLSYDIGEVVCHCREYLEQDYLRSFSVRSSPSIQALKLALSGYSFAEILTMVPRINPSALNAILIGVRSSH